MYHRALQYCYFDPTTFLPDTQTKSPYYEVTTRADRSRRCMDSTVRLFLVLDILCAFVNYIPR